MRSERQSDRGRTSVEDASASGDAITLPRFSALRYTPYHAQVAAYSLLIKHADGRNIISTLAGSRVDVRPHQVECALFALQSPLSHGVLLADETGLGKTVEGGIVIAQRVAERRKKILLIVPASLRPQWRDELWNKFGLRSTLLDGPAIDLAISRHGSLFGGEPQIVIMSYGVASSKAHILATVVWDLIVIDEAHRLRNVYKAGPESHSRKIRDALQGRFKLLLTATPLQNSLLELHGLLSFIDAGLLGSQSDFALLYARKAKTDQGAELAGAVRPVIKRHLRSAVQASGHVAYTERKAATFKFEPYEDEQELYELVSDYLMREDTTAFGSPPNPLVLTVARKLLASSTAAIVGFLRTVLSRLRLAKSMDIDALESVEEAAMILEDVRDLDEAHGAQGGAPRPRGRRQTRAISVDVDDEIAEVESYIAKGEAILSNAKADRLLDVLPGVLDDVCKRGGRRKAVIFTESRKTQQFLVELLRSGEFSEKIITLNGSNEDTESSKLLFEWRARHVDDGLRTGSRSAEVRAAIIETFINAEAALLVSTESGGEGVNLQDCSLVINYDLPWNPQRLEQRIGRCHRYGQKLDVIVLNLQNTRNQVEERLIDLLTRKFKIFEGVFGASNDVLGAIEADVDLAAEIFRIAQTCRPGPEIERAFEALEKRLETAIASDLATARRRLFDTVDEIVIQRLLARDRHTAVLFDEYTRRLAIIVRSDLPEAMFDDVAPLTFVHDGTTWTTRWPDAVSGARHFSLGEGLWASSVVDRAASRSLSAAVVRFDIAAMRTAGFPRLSDVERYVGRTGWLSVSRLSFETAAETMPRAALVVAGLAEDGAVIDSETLLRLFLVPGEVVGDSSPRPPPARLAEIEKAEEARLTEIARNESGAWLADEAEKLNRRVRDVRQAGMLKANELFEAADRRRTRLLEASRLSEGEKREEQREIDRMEKEGDVIILSSLPKAGELRKMFDENLEQLTASLNVNSRCTRLFQIFWEIT